ncbi:uncharacterized protein C4orf54 homolog [Takifugu flavidus]|uniref:DUF4585 domain-containing protein n=1 Tax=Takifugu flavidus TaxID=433684 RepID=A0A5C6N954_9TELE|nr:uncharacterized protein C4orf54 homolog [Takifugu flavidus]XP_056883086.1 uncharacterized protein C4orf54 homolog [Takifugu flavidus]TWW63703.1 hypothetical protein D4764_03G0007110 [Takifugu flavidus]
MKTDKSGVDTPATPGGPQRPTEKAGVQRRTPEKQVESNYVSLEPVDGDLRAVALNKRGSFGETDDESVWGSVPETQPTGKATKSIDVGDGNNNKVPGQCVHVAKGDLSGPLERHSVENKSLQAGSPHQRVLEGEDEKQKKAQTQEKFRSDDYYWSGKSVSDDSGEEEDDGDVTLLLSANPIPCVTDDEAHYITTHEILLAELSDNEGDFDRGSSATWDVEDGSQVCSFVDYASFDSEGAARGARVERPAVSTLQENDPSGSAKSDAAEESLSKAQQLFGGTSVGQIQLSIRATSRAINGPGKFLEEGNILYRATRSGDVSRYVFRGVEGRGEPLRDGAQCFAVAPGRVHFGRKLRAKDVIEHSSGTSSAVSEPDDADKEVRTLTAKTFKSLAHPYFDAVNFGASSESSASERGVGINRWSTFVDMRYGDMSQKLDKTFAAHQNSTTSFEMARNVGNGGHEGTIKVPGNEIFALNASGHNTTSSNKVQLMGKFRQGQSGVITLTETLNFRCNVKSEGERRGDGTGSRSVEDVTDTLPRNLRRVTQPPTKPKEDASKKAIFASSLIKNVISKKMQFEQERKMERGEISEQHQVTSPYTVPQEGEGHRVRRQSSKVSESSSDCTVTNADDLGDIADGGPVETGGDSRSLETTPFVPEPQLESAYEAGIDAKKGTLDASKRTLLRSQNSAFRRWKDDEVEFQKDHKSDQTPVHMLRSASVEDEEGVRYASYGGKLTKMSHLFVPSIQLSPSERGEQLLRAGNDSVGGDGGKTKRRSDSGLQVADSRNNMKSKSPEIKINLRSVKSNKMEPVAVSKLQTSNLGYDNAASLIRNKDFRCQTLAAALRGESADKVPHFTVRDIRDNKAKLQTPIHQVRDVRKLVKSSYHFVSLDNENRPADRPLDQKRQSVVKTPNSVSPIVIKCQSVNTNLGGKQSESLDNHRDLGDTDGRKSAPLHRTAGEVPVGDPFSTPEGDGDPVSQSRLVPKWQEKIADPADKKSESKMASQMALEKLQAAVRTMEQLYVFEKNEWKRKTESRPLTDSHVLSMIAREERAGPEDLPVTAAASPGVALHRGEDKHLKTSGACEERVPANRTQASISAPGGKNIFSLSSSIKTSTNTPQQKAFAQFGAKSFAPMATKPPLKNSQLLLNTREGALSKDSEKPTQESSGASADNENYLTIPVKSHASSDRQVSSTDGASVFTFASQGQPTTPRALPFSPKGQEDTCQVSGSSSTGMETHSPEIPLAAVYHSFPQTMTASQPQLFCFSPAIAPTPTLEPFQAMQRKVLLDPTTGNYYLVDSPLQPPMKRLYDPETGQYVEVPFPQPSTTPVPMSVSPLALSPGAYAQTYMVYPGFMPTPSVISAQTLVQSQMPLHSEGEAAKKSSSQKTDSVYMDSPFYITTGMSSQPGSGAQQQATPNIPLQPIISITSQQGPRIIAPPSFDGTTMSFVVEHR